MLCVVLICISLSKVILNIFSCNYVNISFCFSQTSYGYTFSVLFALLRQILRLVCPLDPAMHRAEWWLRSFGFPEGRADAKVCHLSLACRCRLAFRSPAVCQSSLSLPWGGHPRNQPWGGAGVWGWGTHSPGDARGLWKGDQWAKRFGNSWSGLLMESVMQLVGSVSL